MGGKMTKVIKSSDGSIINIGEWDYKIVSYVDDNGETIIEETNPLPDGAYEDETETTVGWDDGIYASNDPRRLNPNGV